jgi:deoxycytidylate deaminase
MKIPTIVMNTAKEEALKSAHKFKVGAVIFKGKQILSSGHNYGQRSAKKLHPRYQKWRYSIHAEIDSILSAKRDLKSSSILVVRLNNKGDLVLSKPCNFCTMYLEHVGVKNLYYSNNDGDIIWERI